MNTMNSTTEGTKVRLDNWKERLVQLLMLTDIADEGDSKARKVWRVKDLLTEEIYYVDPMRLGKRDYNEMEVVAFVSASGACGCCEEDGGQTHEVLTTKGLKRLCGVCYRNACDIHGEACRKARKA